MNPAERLAAMCVNWAVPAGQSPWTVRGADGDDAGLTTWHYVSAAVDTVRLIERCLDGLDAVGEKTAVYRKYLPAWYRAVYSWGREWTTSTSGSDLDLLKEPEFDALELLSNLLDRLGMEAGVPQADCDALAELFEQALELVNETDEIPEAERVALLGLIQACRATLRRLDVAGPIELRQQVAELSLSLGTVALRMDQVERRDKFTSLAKSMWWKVAAAGVVFTNEAISTSANEAVHAIIQAL